VARFESLIQHECLNCQRTVVFLPKDLLELFALDVNAYARHLACSLCGSTEHVRVTLRTPMTEDIARLKVRRLDRIKQIPVWRDEYTEFDTTLLWVPCLPSRSP
jgi:hypothetical protein